MSENVRDDFNDMAELTYNPFLHSQGMDEAFLSSQPTELPPTVIPYELDDLDLLFDVYYETTTAQEKVRYGLSEESLHLLTTTENKDSQKVYARYQELFLAYLKEVPERGYDEETVVNFFSQLHVTKKYSVGSFWCIFSCIRSYILVVSKVDIKTFPLLRKLLKGLTAKHLVKNLTFLWRRK